MQSRNRQAETSSTSFFNQDYLAAVDRHYGAWLMPPADMGDFVGMPTPGAVMGLDNHDLAKFGDFAYTITIINTDLMTLHSLVRNFTGELQNIISQRVARRREDDQ